MPVELHPQNSGCAAGHRVTIQKRPIDRYAPLVLGLTFFIMALVGIAVGRSMSGQALPGPGDAILLVVVTLFLLGCAWYSGPNQITIDTNHATFEMITGPPLSPKTTRGSTSDIETVVCRIMASRGVAVYQIIINWRAGTPSSITYMREIEVYPLFDKLNAAGIQTRWDDTSKS